MLLSSSGKIRLKQVAQYPSYFKYTIQEINDICNDIDDIEMEIAPYILSNVLKRDIDSRINIYKLKQLGL